jgi:chromosome segregation ATPase
VIEFALLFGLGFLTAVFLGFLIAPAVHRRIVWFTEKRLKATMPLSPQEVRAQKDMARALYAAENAKTEQALAHEREKAVRLQLRQDTLTKEAGRLASENTELQSQIDEMDVEAGNLRSRLRREESYISQLKTSLRISEQAHAEKETDIDGLRKRLAKMTSDADNLKIDLATRETEVENLRFRLNALRDERDTLRNDINQVTKRAKDAEMRLNQEEAKTQRLEDKLNREVAGTADKDTLLERRLAEVARLKDRLKAANAETREASRALRAAGVPKQPSRIAKLQTISKTDPVKDAPVADASPVPLRDVQADIAQMTDEVRNRSKALSDRLTKARSAAQDKAMREEIATIAANMVALTALKEGEQSPIRALLPETIEAGQDGRVSLAERVQDILSDHH